MQYSPYATRLTVFGVLNTDNNKPMKGGRFHSETKFEPTKKQLLHAASYYDACGEKGRAVAMREQAKQVKS